MKAMWNGEVIAESDATVVVEGAYYFPQESVKMELLKESDRKSICPWKGEASYYDVVVGGETNEAAAWYYPDPKPEAMNIKGHIAFWNGVDVSE